MKKPWLPFTCRYLVFKDEQLLKEAMWVRLILCSVTHACLFIACPTANTPDSSYQPSHFSAENVLLTLQEGAKLENCYQWCHLSCVSEMSAGLVAEEMEGKTCSRDNDTQTGSAQTRAAPADEFSSSKALSLSLAVLFASQSKPSDVAASSPLNLKPMSSDITWNGNSFSVSSLLSCI